MPNTKKLEEICKKYDLDVFESPRDNFLMICRAAEPSKEEIREALEIYEEWLIALYLEEE